MSKELMDLLISEACANKMKSREFGNLLRMLRLTGARPGQFRNAEAHNYERGKLVFRWSARIGYVHKTAKTTQRDRVIFPISIESDAPYEGLRPSLHGGIVNQTLRVKIRAFGQIEYFKQKVLPGFRWVENRFRKTRFTKNRHRLAGYCGYSSSPPQ